MNRIKLILAALVTGTLLVPALAFAQDANVSITASVNASSTAPHSATLSAALTTAKSRADQEITRRITAMNALLTRVNAMTRVDASFKTTLAANIQIQITALTALQATIDSDTTASTLKVEIQSITKSYRIFALVLPQANIGAAADRVQTVSGLMLTLSSKLSSRLASSTTTDNASSSAALADANAKIADAQLQATASIGHIAGLQPDNGNKTTMAANTAALKLARADIKVAQQDLAAARKDFASVMGALHVQGSVEASSTVQH